MIWSMAFAVKLIDQFTGLPVIGKGVRVRDSLGKSLIRKEDGWFVLLDNGEDKRTVFINVPGYEPEEVSVDCKAMTRRREACFYQYLIPSKGYRWPLGISFREETGNPGTVHWTLWPETEGILRLLEAYEPDRDSCRLVLKLPKGVFVRDRRILMENGKKAAEICAIVDQEDSACTMEYPLKESYLPKETRISLLYRTVFDQEGRSRIPALSEKR